jgi:hypothetical protein
MILFRCFVETSRNVSTKQEDHAMQYTRRSIAGRRARLVVFSRADSRRAPPPSPTTKRPRLMSLEATRRGRRGQVSASAASPATLNCWTGNSERRVVQFAAPPPHCSQPAVRFAPRYELEAVSGRTLYTPLGGAMSSPALSDPVPGPDRSAWREACRASSRLARASGRLCHQSTQRARRLGSATYGSGNQSLSPSSTRV